MVGRRLCCEWCAFVCSGKKKEAAIETASRVFLVLPPKCPDRQDIKAYSFFRARNGRLL
jgi:hypothetical protein